MRHERSRVPTPAQLTPSDVAEILTMADVARRRQFRYARPARCPTCTNTAWHAKPDGRWWCVRCGALLLGAPASVPEPIVLGDIDDADMQP